MQRRHINAHVPKLLEDLGKELYQGSTISEGMRPLMHDVEYQDHILGYLNLHNKEEGGEKECTPPVSAYLADALIAFEATWLVMMSNAKVIGDHPDTASEPFPAYIPTEAERRSGYQLVTAGVRWVLPLKVEDVTAQQLWASGEEEEEEEMESEDWHAIIAQCFQSLGLPYTIECIFGNLAHDAGAAADHPIVLTAKDARMIVGYAIRRFTTPVQTALSDLQYLHYATDGHRVEAFIGMLKKAVQAAKVEAARRAQSDEPTPTFERAFFGDALPPVNETTYSSINLVKVQQIFDSFRLVAIEAKNMHEGEGGGDHEKNFTGPQPVGQ